MPRRLTLLLVLPTVLISALSVYAQNDDPSPYFDPLDDAFTEFSNEFSDSMQLWGKMFSDSAWGKGSLSDSLFKKFEGAAPFFAPKRRFEMPEYPFPEYFNDPRLPGIPYPDQRNQRNNGEPERVIPKRRDGRDIPNYPGWRIEKLKNLVQI